MKLHTTRVTALSYALIVATVGCGGPSGPVRHDARGSVTFNGQPVPDATIQFDPDTAAGNSGPQGFVKVVNGKFDTSENGKGTVGGPHLVRIEGAMGPDPAKPGNWLYINYSTKLDLPQDDSETNIELPAESVRSSLQIPEI